MVGDEFYDATDILEVEEDEEEAEADGTLYACLLVTLCFGSHNLTHTLSHRG
jgi:hypothetical protein